MVAGDVIIASARAMVSTLLLNIFNVCVGLKFGDDGGMSGDNK
jgi:hypothetical protein